MATCIATLNDAAPGGSVVPGSRADTIETRYLLQFFGVGVAGGMQAETHSIETRLDDTSAQVRNAVASRITDRAAARGLTVTRSEMRIHGPDPL